MKVIYSKAHRKQAKEEKKSLVCIHFTNEGGKNGYSISGAMSEPMVKRVQDCFAELIEMARKEEDAESQPATT